MTSTEALVTGARLFLRHPVSNDRDEFISIREANRSQVRLEKGGILPTIPEDRRGLV